VGGATLMPLTVQRYYALDFSRDDQSTSETDQDVKREAATR